MIASPWIRAIARVACASALASAAAVAAATPAAAPPVQAPRTAAPPPAPAPPKSTAPPAAAPPKSTAPVAAPTEEHPEGISEFEHDAPPDAAGDSSSSASTEYEIFYRYTVRNRTDHALSAVTLYLPIPMELPHQHISEFRDETFGLPVEVTNRTDAYGTKIRRFAIPTLEPGQSATVGWSCVARLAPPQRVSLDLKLVEGAEPMPEADFKKFTAENPIFGLSSKLVKQTADTMLKEHPNPVSRAVAIHDFIASTFKYEAGGGWSDAPTTLKRRAGSCSEFAYVFCALCRATGIPTRFVGASIFPAKSKAPFDDGNWHRWAEAWLPGHGWVPFDCTLDKGKPPKHDFIGTHHGRTLILTKIGSKSLQLGNQYVGANSHGSELARSRVFTWSQGTRAMLAEADRLRDAGKTAEARVAYEALVKDWGTTRAGLDAAKRLATLGSAK